MQTQNHRLRVWDRNRQERSNCDAPKDLEHELGPAVLDACRSIWNEFVELSSLDPNSFGDDEQRLLCWYAELQFRLGTGGGRCSQCRAHVRHALPMRVETADDVRDFRCLCTRCIVGFEHEADRIWYTVAGKFIEHPIRCGRAHQKAA